MGIKLSTTSLENPAIDVGAPSVKQLRHRAEIPMLIVGVLITVLAIGGTIAFATVARKDTPWSEASLLALATPIIVAIMIRNHFWKTVANGVEVTDRQFPEVYAIYRELALRMGFVQHEAGIKTMPKLFVVNGNGVLNAFASKCRVRRGYVVIHSDLVDVAYTHGRFNAVRAVLAHELGHILCGHVNLWRNALNPILAVLRLDKTLTRAQEYTADRVASYYAPDAVRDMVVLYSGKNLLQNVDFDEYLRSVGEMKDGFWLRFVNFFSSHAVGYRRMKALGRVETEGWNVHGKML